MQAYRGILRITGLIQLGGLGARCLLRLVGARYLGIWVFSLAILISTVIGIVLPFMRGEKLKDKCLMVLLMPTNYVWIVSWYVLTLEATMGFIEGIRGIGAEFG